MQKLKDVMSVLLLRTMVGAQCLQKTCPHFGESYEVDGSIQQDIKVNLQLEECFNNCPTWRYLGE